MLNRNRNVETFLGCESTYEESRIVLYGAPFDSTTSYRPGTRFASRTMRAESYGLETYSPYQDLDLEDAKVFDGGDLELCFGDTERALGDIEACARDIVADGKLPFLIGGEHLVTLPAFRAVQGKYPDVAVVHFDAHTDLREEYLGNRLSHATVIRRIWEIIGDGRIFQFGIRSGTREERRFMRDGHVTTELFADTTLDAALASIGPDAPVYLTVDMDVLDPSEFPGTGTQEAGGFRYPQLVADVRKILAQLNVVGLDNVELNPGLDSSGRSTALACKFLREELLSLRV